MKAIYKLLKKAKPTKLELSAKHLAKADTNKAKLKDTIKTNKSNWKEKRTFDSLHSELDEIKGKLSSGKFSGKAAEELTNRNDVIMHELFTKYNKGKPPR